MSTTSTKSTRKNPSLVWITGGAIAVIVIVAIVMWTNSPAGAVVETEAPTFTVASDPLTITINAAGSVRNAESVTIKNEVEGSSTIIYLVEEGTMVNKGDLLVELDSSELNDRKIDQEIKVESAKADHINAEEALEITRKEGESLIKAAQVELNLAELDLQKYVGLEHDVKQIISEVGSLDETTVRVLGRIDEKKVLQQSEKSGGETATATKTAQLDPEVRATKEKVDLYVERFQAALDKFEGEYKQELQEALNSIRISLAELMRQRDKVEGSIRLASKQYITQTEKEADQLDLEKRLSELQIAVGKMKLLVKFTFERKFQELQSAKDQKEFALEKTRHKADSDYRDAETQHRAKKLVFDRETEKLTKIVDQLSKCKMYAPSAGLVVHGTSGGGGSGGRGGYGSEPLAEGGSVYERQVLIRLPLAGAMIADVKIHEAAVKRVREGLPVQVMTDAIPNKKFKGIVKRVAVVPDAQDRWLNPDKRVYNTEVEITEDVEQLRPGMSCTTEILIDHYADTLFVPVESVLQVNGKPTVYLASSSGKPTAKEVEVGLSNNRMIRIISGLEAGQVVLRNPPLPPSARPMGEAASSFANASDAIEKAREINARPAPERTMPTAATEEVGEGEGAPRGRGGGAGNMQRFLAMLPEDVQKKLEGKSQQEVQAWFQTDEGQEVMQQLRSQFQGGGGQGGGGGGAQAPAAGATQRGAN